MAEVLVQFISATDPTEIQSLYDGIFLHRGAAVAILGASQDIDTSFVAKALGVSPQWTTTRCAVSVEQLCGEAMVAATTKPYNEAWLFSLALACEVEIGSSFELSDKQASVAFKLCKTWRRAAGKESFPAGAAEPGGADMDADGRAQATTEEEEEPLEWEEALTRQQTGSLSLDVRSLFERLPKFQGLKEKPEVNNHRQDSTSRVDKITTIKSATNTEFVENVRSVT